jgi:hypothetical protein
MKRKAQSVRWLGSFLLPPNVPEDCYQAKSERCFPDSTICSAYHHYLGHSRRTTVLQGKLQWAGEQARLMNKTQECSASDGKGRGWTSARTLNCTTERRQVARVRQVRQAQTSLFCPFLFLQQRWEESTKLAVMRGQQGSIQA